MGHWTYTLFQWGASQVAQEEERLAPSRWAGFRFSALAEMALFFALALFVDGFFFSGDRFLAVSPHPFWIIVVLITVQYGTNEGLLACALATTALLAGNLPEQELSQDYYQYLFSTLALPLGWFASAVVLGELRLRQLRERDGLLQELHQSQEKEEQLARAYERMRGLKDDLEVKVAGQMETFVTLFKAAQGIEKLRPDEVLLGVNEIVRTSINPEKFSLSLLKEGRLSLAIQNGWESEDLYRQHYTARDLLFHKVVSERKILCAAKSEDEAVLGEAGVLAGPLQDEETGEVYGMLKIERLGFLDFNLSTVHTFKVVSQWIGTTYRNALRYETARSTSVFGEQGHLYSYSFFGRQKEFLLATAARIGFDLSMVVVRTRNVSELSAHELEQIPSMLKGSVQSVLRKTDLAFDHHKKGFEYAIVLPGTTSDDAPVVVEKIRRRLNQESARQGVQARFTLTIQSLYKQASRRSLLPREVYNSRLEFLMNMLGRIRFEVTLLAFELEDYRKLEFEERKASSQAMRKAFLEYLEESDTAFAYQRSAREMLMVLPAADASEARQVGDRMRRKVAALCGQLKTRLVYSAQTVEGSKSEFYSVG